MIPELVFTFWEGKQFTYLHYLTVVTFKTYNPDIPLIVYLSETSDELVRWSSNEHSLEYNNIIDINTVSNIKGVEIKRIDVNKELNYTNKLSPVWKSDIVRILKLYEHGGIYIDFDILFISKIPSYLFHLEKEMAFNTYNNVINNAFIVSHKNSELCRVLLDNILNVLHHNMNNGYQQFGPTLITKLIKNTSHEDKVYYIPNDQTCPYLWNQMDTLFFSNTDLTTKDTFCIHWYNGANSSSVYCNAFNIYNINSSNNIFEKLLSKCSTLNMA